MKSLEERRAERKADEKERLERNDTEVLGGNKPGNDGTKDGLDKSAAGKKEGPIGTANAEADKKAGKSEVKSEGKSTPKTKEEAIEMMKADGDADPEGTARRNYPDLFKQSGAASGNGGGAGFTGKQQS